MDFNKNFEKIETARYVISVMKQALYKNYAVLVDGVISGEIRDPETIRECILRRPTAAGAVANGS